MKENITAATVTVDDREIAHFSAMAEEWWDPKGKFAPLHAMNPVRVQFLRDHIARHYGRDIAQPRPFAALTALDIGSGGGLVCEPLCRLGMTVTGVDAAERNTEIARLHAAEMGLDIAYRHSTAEALAAAGEQYDVVTALEIVEHVADVEAFLEAVSQLVKPGGLLFMSTLNRTAKSYATAIIGAEYLLRWLPVGTHHWKKFLKPSELVIPLEHHGITTKDLQGLVFDPFNRSWSLKEGALDINYLLMGVKTA